MGTYMHLIKSIGVAIFSVIATCALAHAQRAKVVPPEGSEWQASAEKYLTVFEKNRDFDADKDTKGLRCVRMNNYGCMWQRSTGGPWEGTPRGRREEWRA